MFRTGVTRLKNRQLQRTLLKCQDYRIPIGRLVTIPVAAALSATGVPAYPVRSEPRP